MSKFATNSTFKILSGNSCGSGTVVGEDENNWYILSNYHVTGPRGTEVQCLFYDSRQPRTRTGLGYVEYAEIVDRTNIDRSIIRLGKARFPNNTFTPIKIYKGDIEVNSNGVTTGGSANCHDTRYQKVEISIQNNEVYFIRPNAIGGDSGSHILYRNRIVGLITFTNGFYGIAVKSSHLLSTSEDTLLRTGFAAGHNPKDCTDLKIRVNTNSPESRELYESFFTSTLGPIEMNEEVEEGPTLLSHTGPLFDASGREVKLFTERS